MRLASALAAALLVLSPLPALATSCAEQIGTIERRLDSAGAVRITGLASGHALRAGSPRGLAATPPDAPSDAGMISTAEGIGGGRALIRRAVNEDSRGDQRACENTMTDAKGMIGALP